MPYVDGFVIPMPKKQLKLYRTIAAKAGKVWMEHGALEYRECVGEDLVPSAESMGMTKMPPPFPTMTKLKKGETVIFSWIVYRSRAHRDRVNAKVMKDPRVAALMDPKNPPFDMKRVAYGGFETIVDL